MVSLNQRVAPKILATLHAAVVTTSALVKGTSWVLKDSQRQGQQNDELVRTAVNAEKGEVNAAYDLDGSRHLIPEVAKRWRAADRDWLVVAEHNYGEGSAREHAALQPRYLGARIIVCKSFARIHETNLKQGVVPLTFEHEADYDRIAAGDEVATVGLYEMPVNGGNI